MLQTILHLEGPCRVTAATRVLKSHKVFLNVLRYFEVRHCFFRFKVDPHDLDSDFLTSGTECVACFELSHILKDHAEELRPLVY